ncbi:ImmA/IrrE family metallo-endopeptidase [Roseovarius nitratireducens]|uniref:ImmA/IrrE family metallo-endopeptidase n=1 Tax=Roseovarius nitratireducens TaxID=2044597 RepID=UPI000CE19D2B|nr:ImmA/IrrE family metallo-endopeptidase [Roseovarius nitratireducens]
MKGIDPAERLLKSLGVTEPHEIELEDIAFDQGAEIRYCDLSGCEADILGYRDRAIISIDRNRGLRRRRFSIAHELGHWHYHRGKKLQCRVDEYQPKHKQLAERKANGYAASLLMPHYLLKPRARDHQKLTFKTIEQFSSEFRTSLPATAIRLVEADIWPCMLICHTRQGRKWFAQAPMFHQRWFPQAELDPESSAFDAVFGQSEGDAHPRIIGADAWFDRAEAQRYELFEQVKCIGDDEALVLLTIKDDRMMEDEPERFGHRW